MPMAYRRAEQRKNARRDGSSGSRPPSRSRSGPAPEGGSRQAWTRVARSRADAVADRLSGPVAGAFAAGWSAILTLLAVASVIAIAWIMGAGSGSITDAMHVSGISWLATHLIPISVPDGSISALPIGFVFIPGWLLWRAGSWAARRSGACLWQDVRPMVGIGAGVYATIALLVATTTANEAAAVTPLSAIVGAGAFALLVFGAGATKEAGLWPSIVDRFTPKMRLRLRAGLVSFGAIVSASGVLLAGSLAFHFSTGLTILDTLSPGLVGNVLLFILGLAYLPNALIWASSFVVGPGFAVGQDTVVSPFGVQAGAVPAFPLLGGMPEVASSWMPALLVIPLIAGGMGMALASGKRPIAVFERSALIERTWVAGVAASVMFLASWLAGGGLGSGRMSDLGPNALYVGLATFALTFVGGVLCDQLRRARNWRTDRRAARLIDVRDQSNSILDVGRHIG